MIRAARHLSGLCALVAVLFIYFFYCCLGICSNFVPGISSAVSCLRLSLSNPYCVIFPANISREMSLKCNIFSPLRQSLILQMPLALKNTSVRIYAVCVHVLWSQLASMEPQRHWFPSKVLSRLRTRTHSLITNTNGQLHMTLEQLCFLLLFSSVSPVLLMHVRTSASFAFCAWLFSLKWSFSVHCFILPFGSNSSSFMLATRGSLMI